MENYFVRDWLTVEKIERKLETRNIEIFSFSWFLEYPKDLILNRL